MDSPAAAPRDPPARSGRRSPGTSLPVSPFAPWAHALILAGATAAVFLGGGPPQGALGVFLVCAGVAMVACPPRVEVEWRLWLAAAAVVVCAALALLPEHAVPQPPWRQAFDTTPPIVMPGTITTAPALTVFWLVMLTITLLAGLFLLAHPLRSRWLLGFALAAALAAGTYGALSIYARETGWHYPFSSGAPFGFFPNRNHTATFLVVGSLVALGIVGVVLREGRWLVGLLAAGVMAVCAAGLGFYSSSRAGIVFLLLGVILWLAGLGRRHRDRRVVVSFAALLLASGVLFVVSGGEVRDRLLGRTTPTMTAPAAVTPDPAAPPNASGELRYEIYRDASAAIRDFPLTGIGLGTFAYVFPQYRQASRGETIALHPESDWVLFTIEAGVPATLCLITLLALAAGRLKAEREHSYWPLRWGCVVAAGAAALHGLVDVPAHAQPLGWWMVAVAGLALQSARTGAAGRSRAQHALFVAGGIAALVQGGWLVRAEWFGGPPTTLFTYGAREEEFFRVLRPDPSRALRLAQQMARDYPMEEYTYRLLGETLCLFDGTESRVDAAFRAERLVEPLLTATPLQQGNAWLDIDPARTAALWEDALDRCTRNFQRTGLSQQGTPVQFFGNLVHAAAAKPAVQWALWQEIGRGSEYAFAWVEHATPPEAREGMDRLAADEGFLRGLDPAGQRRFLRDWYLRGSAETLAGFLEKRTDWQAAAWPVRLRRSADGGRPEQAVREGAGHYGIALTLPEPGSGDAASPSADQEAGDPAAAFMAYWKLGNVRAARRILDEGLAHAPAAQLAELWRLRTALAVHDADWPTAWHSLEQEIGVTHPGDTL